MIRKGPQFSGILVLAILVGWLKILQDKKGERGRVIVVTQDTTNLFRLHLPEITLDHVYNKASDREQGTEKPRDPPRNKSQAVIFVWSCRRELLLSSCSKRN